MDQVDTNKVTLQSLPNFNNNKKFCLESSQDILEITKPLINSLGASGFAFHRLYKDGSRIYFSTNEKWIEYFYSNDYFLCSNYKKFSIMNVMLWKHWPQHDRSFTRLITDAKVNFDYGNGISINKKQSDYVDSFGFRGFSHDEDINFRYLSNLFSIEKFLNLFLLKAGKLISGAYKNRVVIPEPDDINLYTGNVGAVYDQFHIDNNLLVYNSNIPFSQRESECIYLMLLGKTTKETARKLGISPRTVETHINNIKAKLNCISRSQILSLISSNEANREYICRFFLATDY